MEQHVRAQEGGEWIVSKTRFDTATGLVEKTQSPNEVDNSETGRWNQVIHDDNKLIAKETINELG